MPLSRREHANIENYVNNEWDTSSAAQIVTRLAKNCRKVKHNKTPAILLAGRPWVLDKGIIGKGAFAHVRLAKPYTLENETYDQLMAGYNLLAIKAYKGFENQAAYDNFVIKSKLFFKMYSEYYPETLKGVDVSSLIILHEKKSGGQGAYFPMPYFPGSLRKYINNTKIRQVSDLRKALCATLAVIHAVETFHLKTEHLHRDIKPENIRYNPKTNRAFLVDFDFAMRPGRLIEPAGTLFYIGPEQRKYAKLSFESDIYALASVIAQLLDTDESMLYRAKRRRRLHLNIVQAPYVFALKPLITIFINKLHPDNTRLLISFLERMSSANIQNRKPALEGYKKWASTIIHIILDIELSHFGLKSDENIKKATNFLCENNKAHIHINRQIVLQIKEKLKDILNEDEFNSEEKRAAVP